MEVAKPIQEVFMFVDDDSKTPLWLQRCVELKQTSDGTKKVGTKLHYVYQQGKNTASMDGVVVAHDVNKYLSTTYTDKMFDVDIKFWFSPGPTGTTLKHGIEIKPKSLFGKIISPIIKFALPRQTRKDVEKLKKVLELA